MEELHYQDSFKIRASEVDLNKRLTIPALIKLYMEVAMDHVVNLSWSVRDLEPQGWGWVLSRLHLSLARTPELGEELTIQTYPAGIDRLFTYREFTCKDSQGDLVSWCSTSWILFELTNRRRVNLPEHIKSLLQDSEKFRQYSTAPGRIVKGTTSLGMLEFSPDFYNLDFNGHVSNTIFPTWLLAPLGKDWLMQNKLKELSIIFKKECVYGDNVRSTVFDVSKGVCSHVLRNDEHEDLVFAQSSWR